jgi:RNA polymerase sigma-70 factor (ECF subfamily)
MMSVSEFETKALPHQPFLYSLALLKAKNVHNAEDLVQQTLLKAFVNRGSFRYGNDMRNWLCKILANAFIDEQREAKHYPTVPLDGWLEYEDDDSVCIPSHWSHHREPALTAREDVAEQMMTRMKLAAVVERVNAMPYLHRRIFVMEFCQPALNQKLIAKAVGGTEVMVQCRIHRIRKLLTVALQEKGLKEAA